MDVTAFMNSDIYTFAIIPLMIFLARILDVSIGTIRVIFISKGYKLYAPILGFVEVLIWLLAMRQVMVNLSNVWCYLAYGLGFATGTFVGIYIEEKLSIGNVIVRIITNRDSKKLLAELKSAGYTATSNGAKCVDGKVRIIFTVIMREDVHKVVKMIKKYHPNAAYSVEDVRFVSDPNHKTHTHNKKYTNLFGFYRKAK